MNTAPGGAEFIYACAGGNGGARCSVCGKTYYGAKPAVGGYRQMVI